MMRRSLLTALGLGLLMASPVLAGFDLTLQISDANIVVGGDATIDVYIRSTDAGNLQNLFNFGFQFIITGDPANSPTSGLEFKASQGSSFLNDSNYVFAGDSYDQNHGLPPGGTVGDYIQKNDQLTGGDATNSVDFPNDLHDYATPIDGNSPPYTLLVRLDLTTNLVGGGGLAPKAGDIFYVSLVNPTQTDPNDTSGLTYFQSLDQFNNGTVATYTSTQGKVVVIPASVPEPSTLALLLIGIPIGGLVMKCRAARLARAA